jgi:Protein of unknown function (DUF3429)
MNKIQKEELAGLLGLGGLVPFVALGLLVTSTEPELVELAVKGIVQYAAVILAFVGALHWGIALAIPHIRLDPTRRRMVWSVMPSFAAWGCAMLAPKLALPLLALALAIAWLVDLFFYSRQGNLTWFIKLRTMLTLVAICSLLFVWWNLPKVA